VWAVRIGITQGILVTKLGLPSLIVTIGTLQLPFPAVNYALPVVHESQQTFNSFPLQIIWVVLLGAVDVGRMRRQLSTLMIIRL